MSRLLSQRGCLIQFFGVEIHPPTKPILPSKKINPNVSEKLNTIRELICLRLWTITDQKSFYILKECKR